MNEFVLALGHLVTYRPCDGIGMLSVLSRARDEFGEPMLREFSMRVRIDFELNVVPGGLAGGRCEGKHPAVPGACHFGRGKDELSVGPTSPSRRVLDGTSFHAGHKIIGRVIQ